MLFANCKEHLQFLNREHKEEDIKESIRLLRQAGITNINIDMIGRRDDLHKDSNNYVYVIGSDYLSSDLYTICEEANKNFININLDSQIYFTF